METQALSLPPAAAWGWVQAAGRDGIPIRPSGEASGIVELEGQRFVAEFRPFCGEGREGAPLYIGDRLGGVGKGGPALARVRDRLDRVLVASGGTFAFREFVATLLFRLEPELVGPGALIERCGCGARPYRCPRAEAHALWAGLRAIGLELDVNFEPFLPGGEPFVSGSGRAGSSRVALAAGPAIEPQTGRQVAFLALDIDPEGLLWLFRSRDEARRLLDRIRVLLERSGGVSTSGDPKRPEG